MPYPHNPDLIHDCTHYPGSSDWSKSGHVTQTRPKSFLGTDMDLGEDSPVLNQDGQTGLVVAKFFTP